jgi:hypothetical protein
VYTIKIKKVDCIGHPIRRNVSQCLQLLKKLENFYREIFANPIRNKEIYDPLECIFL